MEPGATVAAVAAAATIPIAGAGVDPARQEQEAAPGRGGGRPRHRTRRRRTRRRPRARRRRRGRRPARHRGTVLTVGVAVVIAALFLAAQLVILRHKRKEELARATGGYHFPVEINFPPEEP